MEGSGELQKLELLKQEAGELSSNDEKRFVKSGVRTIVFTFKEKKA